MSFTPFQKKLIISLILIAFILWGFSIVITTTYENISFGRPWFGDNGLIKPFLFGLVVLIFFGFLLIYFLFIQKKAQIEEIEKKVGSVKIIRGIYHAEEQDLTVMNIIKKSPTIVIPYILFIIVSFSLIIIEFQKFIILNFLKEILSVSYLSWFQAMLYFYIISLIIFSFYVLSYLTIAQLIKKRFLHKEEPFIPNLIINFILAIPFVLILSFLWVLFFFTPKRKGFRKFFLFLFLIVFKYYTYINLANIVFKRKKSFIETYNYFKDEKSDLFLTEIRGGFIAMIIFLITSFVLITIIILNESFDFLNYTTKSAFGLIIIALFFFAILSKFYSEQVYLLMNYIRKNGSIFIK